MAKTPIKPKRGPGRPRKDPNDTTTAPYVKHGYETEGKIGRPKNNPYKGSGWGGAREGAGRPETIPKKDKVTETIAFRVDKVTKERFSMLKESCDIVQLLRDYINRMAQVRLGAGNPKK